MSRLDLSYFNQHIKAVTAVEVAGLLVGWIGAIVAFSVSNYSLDGFKFYWNQVVDVNASTIATYPTNTKCYKTGMAYMVMMSLAFICQLIATMSISTRNFHHKYSLTKLINTECISYSLSYLFYFIGVPIWSGCIAEIGGNGSYDGYGWVIFADILYFFGWLASIVTYMQRDIHVQNHQIQLQQLQQQQPNKQVNSNVDIVIDKPKQIDDSFITSAPVANQPLSAVPLAGIQVKF